MALGFAVGTRGADHNRSGAYEADFSANADRLHGDERSALLAIETEDRAALIDSLILCKFLRGVFADIWSESADLLAKVTGWDVTAEELHEVARRVVDCSEAVQHPRRLDAGRGHSAEAIPDDRASGRHGSRRDAI